MKNVKHEFEQEIQIKKEEMINLTEQNKLELKNIKQNINKSTNYKSIREIFFSYLYSLFFSLCASSFSSCYREEKRREEKRREEKRREENRREDNK